MNLKILFVYFSLQNGFLAVEVKKWSSVTLKDFFSNSQIEPLGQIKLQNFWSLLCFSTRIHQ